MAVLTLVIVLVVALQPQYSSTEHASCKLPPEFKKCSLKQPDLDDCLKNAIQKAVPTLAKGIRSLGILPLDPLEVTELEIPQGDGPVSVNLKFNNFHIVGLSGVVIDRLHLDTKTYELNADLHTTNPVAVVGPYSVDGKVLVLPIKGQGNSNLTLVDPKASGKLIFEKVTKDGEEYIHNKQIDFTFEVSRLHIDLENLFSGNKELGDNMNKFLNENWSVVLDELKSYISAAFAAAFKNIANLVFDKCPVNAIYLDA